MPYMTHVPKIKTPAKSTEFVYTGKPYSIFYNPRPTARRALMEFAANLPNRTQDFYIQVHNSLMEGDFDKAQFKMRMSAYGEFAMHARITERVTDEDYHDHVFWWPC